MKTLAQAEREAEAVLANATQEWHAERRMREIFGSVGNELLVARWVKVARRRVRENRRNRVR